MLVLDGDEQFVKFAKLLQKALMEGRVDGKHRCPVCGMRFNEEKESFECCARVTRH
jgi:hypothetical protein